MSSTTTTLRPRPARDPSPDAQRRRPVSTAADADARVRARAAHPTAAEARPALEVFAPQPSRLGWSRIRRRALAALAALIGAGILFGLVLVHVDLTATEVRLTHLQDKAKQAEDTNLRLRLLVSQLESPSRIVATAQKLGMVPPPRITYLPAVPHAGPPAGSAPVSQPTPAEGLAGWAMTKRIAAAP